MLDKSIWKSIASFKVKSFTRNAVLNRINANNSHQFQRPLAAFLLITVWCPNLVLKLVLIFFHCSALSLLWNNLFDFFGENWICPKDLQLYYSVNFRGFHTSRDAKRNWCHSQFVLISCFCFERNAGTFIGHWLPLELILGLSSSTIIFLVFCQWSFLGWLNKTITTHSSLGKDI